MNSSENDHVQLGEARGFVGRSLHAAFLEIEAISKGTQARQPFFSVSFNPPEGEQVTDKQFYDAFDRLERRLGLTGQPRFPVFHDKNGKRHAHCVWSRIDIDEMKAINMSFFKEKCFRLSRDLFIENGWKAPEGMVNREDKDPFDVFVGEFQKLQKQGVDPLEIKQLCRDAWRDSSDLPSFKEALEESGLFLAKGDKRGFVILDHNQKVYSLSRYGGIRGKELKARLGSPDQLASVLTVSSKIHNILNREIRNRIDMLKQCHDEELTPYHNRKAHLIKVQRTERRELDDQQRVTRNIAAKSTQDRFRRSITKQFEQASCGKRRERLVNRKGFQKLKRKQDENSQLMIFRHNRERAEIQSAIRGIIEKHWKERKELSKSIYELRQARRVVRGEDSQISSEFDQATQSARMVNRKDDKNEQGEKNSIQPHASIRGRNFE